MTAFDLNNAEAFANLVNLIESTNGELIIKYVWDMLYCHQIRISHGRTALFNDHHYDMELLAATAEAVVREYKTTIIHEDGTVESPPRHKYFQAFVSNGDELYISEYSEDLDKIQRFVRTEKGTTSCPHFITVTDVKHTWGTFFSGCKATYDREVNRMYHKAMTGEDIRS